VAAAEIVLADTTGRYDGLLREISARTVAAAQAASRPPEALLADEGAAQGELFAPGGAR
jgi:hypothetical protein